MLARVATFTIDGLDSRRVAVEVDVRAGLPAFTIVGLGDAAVRESRERVRAALQNSGFEFPLRRITANLAPAHLRKAGPGFDLALAVGLLAASGQVSPDALERWALFGELSLGGELRGCRGALAVAEGAARAGIAGLIAPDGAAGEAALVDGVEVAAAGCLAEVADVLAGRAAPRPGARAGPGDDDTDASGGPDLADVRGHEAAIEALVIAAAGSHNLLLEGPPGTGKTMLARRLPSILPPLARSEALEVTRVHSIAGLHDGGGLVTRRPFRAPHHTISAAGLVGGGPLPSPGEATLAHRGVLFLDELSEFARPSLEALRQPLEDGRVAIVRAQRTCVFPARFTLIAATNPCPCGFAGQDDRCRCGEADLARHRRRLSGPLLDRMDLLVAVERPSAEMLAGPPVATSAAARERVLAAREHALRRRDRPSRLTTDATAALAHAYARGDISARGRARALRVARTVADLAGSRAVETPHVHMALTLRQAGAALRSAA